MDRRYGMDRFHRRFLQRVYSHKPLGAVHPRRLGAQALEVAPCHYSLITFLLPAGYAHSRPDAIPLTAKCTCAIDSSEPGAYCPLWLLRTTTFSQKIARNGRSHEAQLTWCEALAAQVRGNWNKAFEELISAARHASKALPKSAQKGDGKREERD